MGLLDVLNGMQQGPRGPSTSKRPQRRGRNVADDHGDPRACLPTRRSSISAAVNRAATPARARPGAEHP